MNQTNVTKSIRHTEVYDQVQDLQKYFANIWWDTNKEFPRLNNKSSYRDKKRKEKEVNKFINKFIKSIEQYPANEENRKIWKENINKTIDSFIDKSELFSMEDKDLLLNRGLLQLTEKFVKEARDFDLSMKIEDIGQAMRNVWIMNIIQMLLDKNIAITPSVFSYSMLYPYTDNYLDNKGISKEEKIRISNRFEKRLEGYPIESENEYEEKIFELVRKIEEEYDRESYPLVFESLLSMHWAQIKSLQQQGDRTGPYEKDILGISFEKGGISVLADAYLVNGTLTEEEAIFFFGYGVLLQICDDLQDGESDFQNGHMTIVSQLVEKWPLDNITNMLINFTFDHLENTHCFNCSQVKNLKELIGKNCIQLILFSVALSKKLYTKKYFNEIKQYFPYRERYMRNIHKRLRKKFKKIEESYNGTKTEKIVMEALT